MVSVKKERNERKERKSDVSISFEGDDGQMVMESSRTHFTQYTNDGTDGSDDGKREQEREIFAKAREYLNPGRMFRLFVRLYAERKLLVFFFLHFVSTMVIWGTCLLSFEEDEEDQKSRHVETHRIVCLYPYVQ